MTTGRWAPLLLALGALAPAAPAHAMPALGGVIAVGVHQARAGDGVTVEATVCPKGQTVEEVGQRTVREGDSAASTPFEPLNLDAISLAQTDIGSSFTVTAEEARTMLWFRLTCGDGSSVTTDQPVMVFPPTGEFWWTYNTPGQFVAAAGSVLELRVATMDCDTSFGAEVDLHRPDGGEPLLHVEAPFNHDGSIAIQLALPASTPPGVYVAEMTCSSLQRGGVTDSAPIHVVAASPELTPTGSGRGIAGVAAILVAFGALLLWGAGPRRNAAG